VIELEQENKELREQLNRIEAELIAIRTAATNGIKGQQTEYQLQSSLDEQLASPAPSGGVTCDSCTFGNDCACLNSVVAEPTAQLTRIPETAEDSPEDTADEKCGLCSSGSCLCEDLGIRSTRQKESTSSSQTSPTQGIKRKRSGTPPSAPVNPAPVSYPMEIDFTSAFSKAPVNYQSNSLPSDSCGFCSPGTPCVCLPNTRSPIQSEPSPISEARPEGLRRNGGRRPQINNVKIPGGVVPRVGSPITIATGDDGCTGEPGNRPPIFWIEVNNRHVFAMSGRSDVNVILSDFVTKIGDPGVVRAVTPTADEETGDERSDDGGYVFAVQCGLSDDFAASEL